MGKYVIQIDHQNLKNQVDEIDEACSTLETDGKSLLDGINTLLESLDGSCTNEFALLVNNTITNQFDVIVNELKDVVSDITLLDEIMKYTDEGIAKGWLDNGQN